MDISPQVRSILRCPSCKGELTCGRRTVRCKLCQTRYAVSDSGVLDLRLKEPTQVTVSVRVPIDEEVLELFDALSPFPTRQDPELVFGASDVQRHVDRAMLSQLTRAKHTSDLALDLGCGGAGHRPLLERCGYHYVGVDCNHSGAPMLGDAHALPFADESFSFALSIAVLEHLSHPMVALDELYRVLKPGATFIGTVAFLEACHGKSFYHFTHRGAVNALLTAGFEIACVGYNEAWVAPLSLHAHLFCRLPSWTSRLLAWPLHAASAVYWRVGSWVKRNATLPRTRRRNLAGAFAFVARRPSR